MSAECGAKPEPSTTPYQNLGVCSTTTEQCWQTVRELWVADGRMLRSVTLPDLRVPHMFCAGGNDVNKNIETSAVASFWK